MHTYTLIYTHAYIYTHLYIHYIYMHTYIHIHTDYMCIYGVKLVTPINIWIVQNGKTFRNTIPPNEIDTDRVDAGRRATHWKTKPYKVTNNDSGLRNHPSFRANTSDLRAIKLLFLVRSLHYHFISIIACFRFRDKNMYDEHTSLAEVGREDATMSPELKKEAQVGQLGSWPKRSGKNRWFAVWNMI